MSTVYNTVGGFGACVVDASAKSAKSLSNLLRHRRSSISLSIIVLSTKQTRTLSFEINPDGT